MREHALAHLTDEALLHELSRLIAQDREITATLVAHLAEVDARKLYGPAGYPSMHAYCVEELRLSEDAASKRIHAARAGRRFPALLTALADGRLHLTAIRLLAPHLTDENVGELVEAATHRRRAELEVWLARRFQVGVPRDSMRPIASAAPESSQDAQTFGSLRPTPIQLDCDDATQKHAPGHVSVSNGDSASPSPQRFEVRITIEMSTREKLEYARALLSHAVPTGDLSQVLDRALDALIAQQEKRKFGVTSRPRAPRRSAGRRHVPAGVRRAVFERDGGRFTFVGANGKRCGSRRFLEFDHVRPVAFGGEATVDGIRLRCRTHNQLEAERDFGAGFMAAKRAAARIGRARAGRPRAKVEAKRGRVGEDLATRDVLAGLRSLGCRGEVARRAAEFGQAVPGASVEQRMRAALTYLGKRSIEDRTARARPQSH